MARRFIVDEKDINRITSDEISIQGDEVRHIQVLRHNVGEDITLNTNVYTIVQIKRDSIILKYKHEAPIIGIPNINVKLYIAMLKNEKMDFVVQKAVELGIKEITPFFSTNVIVKLDEKGKQKRKEKLSKIADEACKQCGRMDEVTVNDFVDFKELKDNLKNNSINLFAYEASKDSLKSEINNMKDIKPQNIGIIIGPEGGFTSKEAEELNNMENIKCVSLGERILRAETAVLNLLSIVIYEMEE